MDPWSQRNQHILRQSKRAMRKRRRWLVMTCTNPGAVTVRKAGALPRTPHGSL